MDLMPGESPVKKRVIALESPVISSRLRMNIASILSLRPYTQTRENYQPIPESTPMTTSAIHGQQITPWPQVDWTNSPLRFALKPAPEIEPPLVFQPLRPAKKAGFLAPIKTVSPSASLVTTPCVWHDTTITFIIDFQVTFLWEEVEVLQQG